MLSAVFPPASAESSHLSSWLCPPPSHTCWQSALTCVVPVCMKKPGWRDPGGFIFVAYIHTCVQSGGGGVYVSVLFCKGDKYSGVINVYILNSRLMHCVYNLVARNLNINLSFADGMEENLAIGISKLFFCTQCQNQALKCNTSYPRKTHTHIYNLIFWGKGCCC